MNPSTLAPASNIEALQAQLAAALAAQAKADAKRAITQRAEADRRLAQATTELLDMILRDVTGNGTEDGVRVAEHAKQLQPLAASYGYRIVKIGSTIKSALVKV